MYVSISIHGMMHLNIIKSMLNQALRDNAAIGKKIAIRKPVFSTWLR